MAKVSLGKQAPKNVMKSIPYDKKTNPTKIFAAKFPPLNYVRDRAFINFGMYIPSFSVIFATFTLFEGNLLYLSFAAASPTTTFWLINH